MVIFGLNVPRIASFKRQAKLHQLLEPKDHFFLKPREQVSALCVCHRHAASDRFFSWCFPSYADPGWLGKPLLFKHWQTGEGREWPCT